MGNEFLVGAVLPPLIDVINKHVADSRLRFGISLVICLLVGALFNLKELSLSSVGEVLTSATTIFTSAQVVYNTYWKKSTARKQL